MGRTQTDPELCVCQVSRVTTTPTLGPVPDLYPRNKDPDLSNEAINSGTE